MDERTYVVANKKNSIINAVLWERIRSWIFGTMLVVIDYMAVLLAVCTAYFLRANVLPLFHQSFTVSEIYLFMVIPLAFVFFLHFDRQSIRKLYFWQQVERIFKASLYAMLLVLAVSYLSGSAQEISRIFMLLVWIFSFVYLAVGRYILKRVVTAVGALQVPTIIIGAGKTAELLIEAFQQNMGSGYKIVGFIEDDPQPSTIFQQYPVLGTFARAEEAVQRAGVRNVLIAAPGLPREELLQLVYRLQPYVDHITFVPDLFGVPVGSMELETLFNEKTVLLKIRNNLARVQNRLFKWMFDCICSLSGLIVVMPLFLVISLFLYVDSPGPIIFAHKRVGAKGESFPCYKFRTMVMNSQEALIAHLAKHPEARREWERDFKLKDDPRITKVGQFLRKTSLDELPQFFNVIKGEMSLVGPRPIVTAEIERYGEYINDYYLVRPGITGMWQVNGRNDVDYPERVKLDSWYVRNWSMWLDIVILMKTIKVVVAKKGAY
jgi:Undecaprenyl-phosphate galactose phosphotransferase WbaP